MTTSTVVQKVQAVQTVQTLRSVQIVQAQAATPAGATLRLLQLVIDFKIKVGNISPTDLFRDWYAGACLAVLTALRFHRICWAGVLRGRRIVQPAYPVMAISCTAYRVGSARI
jgi:hypothetical protein